MTVSNALEVVAEELRLEITNNAFYDPNTNDFRPVVQDLANYKERRQNLLDEREKLAKRNDPFAQEALKKLENLQTMGDLPFDALLVADGGKRLQAIAALLPYYDIDPKKTRLLGTGLWDLKTLASEPALIGGWFAAPPNKERQSFIKNYQEMFGSLPPRLATLAYDATALAAIFVKPDGRFDSSEILVPEGFGGRDGIFRFSAQGLTHRGLSVYQVEERGIKVIEKKDSLKIYGNPSLNINKNIVVRNFMKDHRIFMMACVAGLTFKGSAIFKINDSDSIKTSFPSFLKLMKKIGAKIK